MSNTTQKILIVDDAQDIRITLYEILTKQGYEVTVVEDGRMALDYLQKNRPDMVISDIEMPVMDGISFLQKLRATDKELPVVMMTGYGTIETAVAAMKNGAIDYLLKPFSADVIIETIGRILEQTKNPFVPGMLQNSGTRDLKRKKAIVGQDERFVSLLDRAKTVAPSKATVLILGESGTGKEVVAQYIHQMSNRKHGPFVALNCAALPEGLLESELFGHEKGAFTGAITAKKGKFELADSGTLLLDEIGEVPLHLQAKLLRVLQEEEVDRLGGKSPIKVDVHVLATTNRDLQKAVDEGSFRQDLYYRLNVIPLRLPPLRERKNDIPLLAAYFIDKYANMYDKGIKKLSEKSLECFLSYTWPGNVREMENLIERGVLLAAGIELEITDFWDHDNYPPENAFEKNIELPSASKHETMLDTSSNAKNEMPKLKDVERQMILQSLARTDNNRTHAAKMLGISVRTLRNKLHEYRTQGFVK